jgi:hypothetical protein
MQLPHRSPLSQQQLVRPLRHSAHRAAIPCGGVLSISLCGRTSGMGPRSVHLCART